MIWYIIFALMLIIAAVLGIIAKCQGFHRDTTHLEMIAFLLVLASLIGFACIICTHMEHKTFIETYNEQKILYDTLAATDPEQSSPLWITDIMAVNKDLAELKGRKRVYGMWSILPESIFELEPIGMPVG